MVSDGGKSNYFYNGKRRIYIITEIQSRLVPIGKSEFKNYSTFSERAMLKSPFPGLF